MEADEVWTGHDATRVDALFWAFLNRPVSASDVATYVGTLAERGLEWTVASILDHSQIKIRQTLPRWLVSNG